MAKNQSNEKAAFFLFMVVAFAVGLTLLFDGFIRQTNGAYWSAFIRYIVGVAAIGFGKTFSHTAYK